jgi:catechol 2,3-dioxygenase-like lactoylglutathione lyase family enzyme
MISVEDVLWARYAAPDLDLMEIFLKDFGLIRVHRTATTLYMRGHGPVPLAHVTDLGESDAVGFALRARSKEDLSTLAESYGTSVVERDEPGGGHAVTIRDPDGNRVEVVHGYAERPLPLLRPPFKFNPGDGRARQGGTVRTVQQPSQVLRLGHVMLRTKAFKAMRDFYIDVLGMKISDSYYAGPRDNVIASFLHCGLGSRLVDHHSVALVGDGHSGFEHTAFEVLDLDDVMMGHQHLASRRRWKHSWGVGRHFEGSQVFDYWRDPFGNKIEHWTDGDLVNDDYPEGSVEFNPMTCLAQWGPPVTADFAGQPAEHANMPS